MLGLACIVMLVDLLESTSIARALARWGPVCCWLRALCLLGTIPHTFELCSMRCGGVYGIEARSSVLTAYCTLCVVQHDL
jgi:hypothetical protein